MAKGIAFCRILAHNDYMDRVNFKKVQTGIFDCYLDGIKTQYQIINGSAGLTGRDTINTYCIAKNGELVKALGPLRTCKFFLTDRLTKVGQK